MPLQRVKDNKVIETIGTKPPTAEEREKMKRAAIKQQNKAITGRKPTKAATREKPAAG